jgi:hypothetical protein
MSRFIVTVEPLENRQFLSASPAGTYAAVAPAGPAAVAVAAAPKPSEGGLSLTETVGQKFTARLGEFTYKTVDQLLNAVIYWGDGTHSDGTLVGSYATGEYYVAGTHTYTHADTYKVNVKVFGRLPGSPIVPTEPLRQFTSVIKATAPKPTPGGRTLVEVAKRKFTERLGEFTLRAIDLVLNADINWGDGTHSAGQLVGSYATGEYYVVGTHTYAHTGTFPVVVKIFGRPVGSNIQPTEPLARFTSVVKVLGNT